MAKAMKYVVTLTLIALVLSGCGVQSRITTQKAASQDINQEFLEQSIQPTLDTCRPLTKLENQLLTSSKVTIQDKGRVLDTLLVTLRGTQCSSLVDNLLVIFKDSTLIDLITQRVQQMQKITAKDLLDIWNQNNALVFDGGDVWSTSNELPTVKQIEGKDEVLVSGLIRAEGKSFTVSTVLPKEMKSLSKEGLVKATRGQAMYLENSEFKYAGITTQVRAAQVFGEIKKRIPQDTAPGETPATTNIPAAPTVLKFTFDLSDKERLNYCGAQSISEKIIEQVKKNPMVNIEALLITDLEIAKTEPEAPQKKFKILSTSNDEGVQKAELEQKMFEYSLSPVLEQNFDKQGFWVLSQNEKAGKMYSLETLQKPADFSKGAVLNYSFFERQFDFSNTNQIERSNEKGALSYTIKALSPVERKLRAKFDSSSAYWFKVRSESVAKCMEQNKFAGVGASRDSIKVFIIFSIFDKIYSQKLSQLP